MMEKYLNSIKEQLLFNDSLANEQLKKCESPIESLMYLALLNSIEFLGVFQHRYYAEVTSQKEIGGYRTDLSITVHDLDTVLSEEYVAYAFAIECDGHEFHEKTKEQARNDRARERFLMKEGYTVIRFTGSEIYKDPIKCAKDVWKIIFATIETK